MNREADYTIKGFLYQFNKSLEQIINLEHDQTLTLEGIIEDIDITDGNDHVAIQCKYHETKDQYTLSDIFKPILQMLLHYANHPDSHIKYILFAHFPGEKIGNKSIEVSDIDTILKTKNKSYVSKYVSNILDIQDPSILGLLKKDKKSKPESDKIFEYITRNEINLKIDIAEFLKEERFQFIVGESFESLAENVKSEMKSIEGLSCDDVEDLFYPNALQKIAEISSRHTFDERIVCKATFVEEILDNKKTAITRWTRELKTYDELLKIRRNQLKRFLQLNNRTRYFLFDPTQIESFSSEIVNFITDYIGKYHYKPKLHVLTPLFGIKGEDRNESLSISSRLYSKGIRIEDGFQGDKFFQDSFIREPKRMDSGKWVEFQLRICNLTDDAIGAINSKKCDDLFLIGNFSDHHIDLQDINQEILEVHNFNELKYLLLLQDSIQ